MDLNVWVGEGFVGSNPTISYVGEKGTARCFFTLANHRGFKNRRKTNWVPCVIWGERGEKIMKYLEKGTKLKVRGELTVTSWKGDDGEWNRNWYINCGEVNFESNGNGGDEADKSVANTEESKPADSPFEVDDDSSTKSEPSAVPKEDNVPDENLEDLVDWE